MLYVHHIQRHILRNLIKSESLRYKDLKPHAVDANLFMYHLKQLLKDDLVSKTIDGLYCLSPHGKILADHTQFDDFSLRKYEQPRLILLLAIQDHSKGWLLHTRSVQPVINMTGFVHCNLEFGESIKETSRKRLKNLCGLKGTFTYRGSATIAIQMNQDLESYVHALILHCANPIGTLIQKTEIGVNEWCKKPDFNNPNMLPSMEELIQLINEKQLFFIERSYTIKHSLA